MPKFSEMLLKLEDSQYAPSLHLNMEYYHILLRKNASNLCTIIILQGKYPYHCLPMGVANSQEILQQKMNDLFRGYELIRTNIYNPLILTKGDWKYHLQKLELILNNLKENDLNVILKTHYLEKLK